MNYYRWSSLPRAYDLTLRHNQLILALTAGGAILGFFAAGAGLWPGAVRALAGGVTVFLAAALAKELDPDSPWASLIAAALVLPFVWIALPFSLIALAWLLGGLRCLNRSTGLAPKLTDLLVLLVVAAWLCWQVTPLFGILVGILLVMDAILPDGRRLHAALGVMIIVGSSIWLLSGGRPVAQPAAWLVAILMSITVGFIAVILNTYHPAAVGDATGRRLNPARVQAGQAFGLSAGLFLSSWLGETGTLLLVALWAALVGIIAHHLLSARLRRSVASV